MRRPSIIFTMLSTVFVVLLVACSSKEQPSNRRAVESESREAKNLLQGIWLDDETGEVSFRALGDSIFYPDSINQPTFFKIVHDSLVLSSVGARYPIVKQSEHVFWFKNQNGDELHLVKSDDPVHVFAFVHDRPRVLTYTEVVKTDSVVFYDGERYHWYLAINPTKYKVHTTSYNNDGVEVDNVYYDNIMHISLFHGGQQVFSSDIKKQMYSRDIPQQFLSSAVLSNMEYSGVDSRGFRFVATICIPGGASCYRAENVISFQGKLTTKLIEFE